MVILKDVFLEECFKTFGVLKHLENKTVESRNSRTLGCQERIRTKLKIVTNIKMSRPTKRSTHPAGSSPGVVLRLGMSAAVPLLPYTP